MQLDFQVEERPAQPAVSMRTQTPISELPSFFDRAFPGIYNHITEAGQHPAGPPLAIYHNQDMENLDIEACFPVEAPLEVDGELRAIEVPGGTFCTAVLHGSYEQLPEAWAAMMAHAAEEGLEAQDWVYEIYLNDPSTVAADEIQTQLVLPLK